MTGIIQQGPIEEAEVIKETSWLDEKEQMVIMVLGVNPNTWPLTDRAEVERKIEELWGVPANAGPGHTVLKSLAVSTADAKEDIARFRREFPIVSSETAEEVCAWLSEALPLPYASAGDGKLGASAELWIHDLLAIVTALQTWRANTTAHNWEILINALNNFKSE